MNLDTRLYNVAFSKPSGIVSLYVKPMSYRKAWVIVQRMKGRGYPTINIIRVW